MSKTSQQLPTIKIDDYDEHQAGQHAFSQPGHMTSQPGHLAPPQTGHMTPSTGGNFEIYRHINALLENSLNLSGVSTPHQPDPTLRGAWPPSLETIPEVPLSTASQSLFNYASTGMGGAPAYPEFRLFSNTQPPITHWNPAPTLETLPRAIRGDRTPSSGYASLTESTDSLYNAGQGASLIRSLLPSCSPALPEPQMDSSQNALVNMMNLLSLESEGGKALLWDKSYYPGYPEFSMVETDLGQAAMPLMLTDADVCAIDGAARLHRNAASLSEASCTWSGTLPVRQHRNPTYSCMLFLGGVPWDITEADLQAAFGQFGNLTIEWPGKDGYVYLLFESEKSVRNLLDACTHDYSTGEYFVKISSRRMRSKEVQAIPWVIADSNYVKQSSRRLDSKKTVFVGALHGTITADGLARIMNDLFGNVIYAGIDTNKHKYPIGSGRVTFSSEKSYMKAVQAAFVKIKTPKFTKKIQIDPYLDDAICSRCSLQQGPYFCRNMACFRYFCSYCWYAHHTTEPLSHHKPLTRNTRGNYSPHFP